MPRNRCWLCVMLVPAALLFFADSAHSESVAQREKNTDREREENALALMSKLLCSGVFVIGREPDEFIRNDLRQSGLGLPDWDDIDIAIDRAAGSVTLKVEGLAARTTLFHGDQGCTLLPRGAQDVSFKPVRVKSSLPDSQTQIWPMGDKPDDRRLPENVDAAAIKSALSQAFDETSWAIPQNTRALIVLHKGRIVGERYAPGFDKNTRQISWSMGKSITSALVGVLVKQGHFKVDDPAPVAQWRQRHDPRARITLADLLHMSSGLRFHRGSIQDGTMFTGRDHHHAVYFGAVDVFDYSSRRDLEFPPNRVWRYRNCDPLVLGRIIRETVEAQGEDYLTFPQRALFDPIGVRNMVLEVDPYGNFIMTGFDYGTARDWARFGLLHLQNGTWQGKRILPEGWVDFVTTPAPAAEEKHYGGLFWLNRGGQYAKLPKDMYWAAGHHGQTVAVVPSRDIVIVRLGHSVRGGYAPYFEKIAERILAAIEVPDQ